jgi:cyclopropane-fatty-acyl-phospholipid synthase
VVVCEFFVSTPIFLTMSSLHSTNHTAPLISNPAAPMAAQRALRMLESLTVGGLTVALPDQRELTFGTAQSGPQASMRIHDWQVFALTMRSGDIGFAESYIAKQWDTPDLTTLLQLLVANRRVMDDLIFGTWWGRLAYQVRHWMRRNTKKKQQQKYPCPLRFGQRLLQSVARPQHVLFLGMV